MEKVVSATYASSLTDLREVNSSFDTGVLKICYPGLNRNGSFISKETLERATSTIYNCPVVCNYSREDDSFGGHDVEIVRDADGNINLVNATQPVGVVPESARVWFDECVEDDGTKRLYLFTDVLLWRRQEAYGKLRRDGFAKHSMEISVKDGEVRNGVFYINDFEFTAFALIGVEPCFEGSGIELFATHNFKQQLAEMMQDLKDSFTNVNPSVVSDVEVDDTNEEGGTEEMEIDNTVSVVAEPVAEEQAACEEVTETFASNESVDADFADIATSTDAEDVNAEVEEQEFALDSNIKEELWRAIDAVRVNGEFGEYARYCYADMDYDAKEVYCWDSEDWLLYGFRFDVVGDEVVIDFESKKRKKYAIVDFDEGEQESPFVQVFNAMKEKIASLTSIEQKYEEKSADFDRMESELNELREFKMNSIAEATKREHDAVIDKFSKSLSGDESFEALRAENAGMTTKELEEKCFAILGRMNASATFAMERKPKILVAHSTNENEPYGGLVVKYGHNN